MVPLGCCQVCVACSGRHVPTQFSVPRTSHLLRRAPLRRPLSAPPPRPAVAAMPVRSSICTTDAQAGTAAPTTLCTASTTCCGCHACVKFHLHHRCSGGHRCADHSLHGLHNLPWLPCLCEVPFAPQMLRRAPLRRPLSARPPRPAPAARWWRPPARTRRLWAHPGSSASPPAHATCPE